MIYQKSCNKVSIFQRNWQLNFTPFMHEIGPWVPNHYVFGDQLDLKNSSKLIFYAFFRYIARKHMIP